jgi:hypothetical protein
VLGVLAAGELDPDWPPVLIALVVGVALAALVAITVMFRRFRAAARDGGPRRRDP